MATYTFYVLDFDGYLVGGTSVVCADEVAAIAQANELLGTFDAAVEVWDESRKVAHIDAPPRQSGDIRKPRHDRDRVG